MRERRRLQQANGEGDVLGLHMVEEYLAFDDLLARSQSQGTSLLTLSRCG